MVMEKCRWCKTKKPGVLIRNAGQEIYLLDPKILKPNSMTK
jgi:hypothetical protein